MTSTKSGFQVLVRFPGGVALLGALLLAFLGSAQAASPPPTQAVGATPAPVVQAYAADYGVSTPVAESTLIRQSQAPGLEAALANAAPGSYGGLWFDNSSSS